MKLDGLVEAGKPQYSSMKEHVRCIVEDEHSGGRGVRPLVGVRSLYHEAGILYI